MPSASVRVRVPFVDVDSSHRIHYTAMLRYMEVAEHQLMRELGLPYATTLREYAFPRVHVACDFAGPIVFDDILEVTARVELVGTSSWTIAFAARHATDTEKALDTQAAVLARGKMTIVCMDPRTERAAPLPAALRHALTRGDEEAERHPASGSGVLE